MLTLWPFVGPTYCHRILYREEVPIVEHAFENIQIPVEPPRVHRVEYFCEDNVLKTKVWIMVSLSDVSSKSIVI